MKEAKRYLVTSALPYANGPLHIGQIAGAYLPADIYVRYLRLMGKDVAFICGSDEHGAAITLRAKKEGRSPEEIVNTYHHQIKTTFERFGMSFDIYHRTSDSLHHETAQEFFTVLHEKGQFIEQETEQYYDEVHRQFLADRYITGSCPKCGHDGAYGDQCEKCGASLSPKELIDPVSKLSGMTPVLKKTKHWFLPMDRFEPWLKEWLIEGHKEWKANVYGQCKSWIDGGLQPRAMTRDLDWGVKVPLKDAEGKVLYVWLDAPIGYISATKAWAKSKNKDWKDYWQSEDCRLIHFIGKDNIVFHCIIFPILLHAHGDFILPDNVPANEFLNLEGDKISTSRNHAIWLHEYLDEFPGRQDELRYVLCSIMPETKDSEFTWKGYQNRVNNELVAIFGNFVNRVMVLCHKYFNGTVPPAATTKEDAECLDTVKKQARECASFLDAYRMRDALSSAMNIARTGNQYLAVTEPWHLIKTDKDRVATILNTGLQICAALGTVMEPFLPFGAAKLREMLGSEVLPWSRVGNSDLITAGNKLGKPALLYRIIEDEIIENQRARLNKKDQPDNSHNPVKEPISYETFAAMDIRVATIIGAEKHPDADKLLVLELDTGVDKRTVVSGIAEIFKPGELQGQKVCVLMNLKPRKLRGIESRGMILMAEDQNGRLCFLSAGDIANGSPIS